MNSKILVIGSSNVDFLIKGDKLPAMGETVTGGTFLQTYGGKGANQALSAARAGGEVTFVSCLGDDIYSREIIHNFQKDDIDSRFMFIERKLPTGAAIIMLDDKGDNYLSVAPGANYSLTPDRIDNITEVIKETAVIVLQMEIPMETNERIIELACKYDKPVVFNFAPFRNVDCGFLRKLTVLVVNETEAECLTGQRVETDEDVRHAAHILKDMGPEIVVITLGANGVLIITDTEVSFVPAFKVEAQDTTAAGDVFCGNLAVALANGLPLPKAVRVASAASAVCVTRIGAQPSVPYREEVDAFLEQSIVHS
jgi:ribokinase